MPKNEITKNIHSYSDLLKARRQLKDEVLKLESEMKNNTLLKVGTALFSKDKSTPFNKPLSFIPSGSSLSPSSNAVVATAESLLGTLLISNKITRKYFIAYTVAKEMVPFAIKKFSEIFKKKDTYY